MSALSKRREGVRKTVFPKTPFHKDFVFVFLLVIWYCRVKREETGLS